jgi:[ribosomal protein S5]-alanine N-acetyltransferase
LAIQVDGSLALTTVLETERLALRQFSPGDAPFVLGLFNDAAFLRFIGDKRVRTEEDAIAYIEREYIASYRRNGFGPYCVMLKTEPVAIGMCGLLRRDWLPDTDLGYAFLPAYWRNGYAVEAAKAVVDYAVSTLGMARVVAITDPENLDSMKVLTRVGFAPAGIIRKAESEPPLNLFSFETA